jgi:predicted RND superfamily exporter protein
MTLGIVVDDTVHFLTKYLRARREKGLGPEDAVLYAFSTVGPAIVATTIILMIGFGILSFSSFALNSWMAQLTTIVIGFALIADLIFLPAFLITFDRHKTQKQASRESEIDLETKPATV